MNNKGSRCKMHLKRCFRCILRAAQLKICCNSDEKWQEERSKQRCRKEAERRWWRVGGAEHYVISVAGRKMHKLSFVTKYKTTSLNYASSKDVIVPKIDNQQFHNFCYTLQVKGQMREMNLNEGPAHWQVSRLNLHLPEEIQMLFLTLQLFIPHHLRATPWYLGYVT